jgi:hypothetical protein
MSIFDSILGAVGGGESSGLANIAAKVGISPEAAEQAVAALGAAHQEPGDTVQGAADKTGLDPSIISQLVEHIGGEGSLGKFAQMISDNPQAQGMLSGLAGKFFGKS